jgi:hypothetical protein
LLPSVLWVVHSIYYQKKKHLNRHHGPEEEEARIAQEVRAQAQVRQAQEEVPQALQQEGRAEAPQVPQEEALQQEGRRRRVDFLYDIFPSVPCNARLRVVP